MHDPFIITDRTALSVSGGRTSGYMLHRVLEANGGLPDNAVVMFANTGKEDEATLRFVRDIGQYWGVPITWIEYRAEAPGYAIVDFDTASRNGEPFEAVIGKRQYLPNPVTRFCTVELKIRARPSPETVHETMVLPLAAAGVTKKDVGDFWRAQPFDLGLPNHNGVTYEGNCDLCFLKGRNIVQTLIAAKPSRAVWWASQESRALNSKESGARFRNDRPSYQTMLERAQRQEDMFEVDEGTIACFCGDDA